MTASLAATRERVIRIVGQIMGVAPDALDDASSPESVAAWDSLKHMRLVLALEEEFDVRFSDDQIMAMPSVAHIITHLHELRR